MSGELSEADTALLARVLGHEIEPGLVRTLGPSTLAAIIHAARSEGPRPSPGVSLPVVITDEMALVGAVAMMPDAFGDSEREWAPSIRDTLIARSRACLTAALSLPLPTPPHIEGEP